ncbi:hypothetical protein MVEN_00912900 [Mycena venus]|uniref:Uncharacterized protein n=1 Tax=Mycena venus TaxID=2733690 RepID=A0A8H6Y7R8_9AGAR|nr:hypothetical protein MVEN_00912900 [Mycena venus]
MHNQESRIHQLPTRSLGDFKAVLSVVAGHPLAVDESRVLDCKICVLSHKPTQFPADARLGLAVRGFRSVLPTASHRNDPLASSF